MFWSKCFAPCTLSAVLSWTFRTKTLIAKTKLSLAGLHCFYLTNSFTLYSCILQPFQCKFILWCCFSANSERTRKRQSSLKPLTFCLTPLSPTTCGIILHAGLRSAAGVCGILGEKYNVFLFHTYLTSFSFCRWTQSSHNPGKIMSSETSARSLVEFCELVDFLLDIVSLVGKL